MIKVQLEIGENLRSSIESIIDECNRVNGRCEYPQLNPGDEVHSAFGINFVKLMKQDPEFQNLEVTIEKKKTTEHVMTTEQWQNYLKEPCPKLRNDFGHPMCGDRGCFLGGLIVKDRPSYGCPDGKEIRPEKL